MAVLQNFHLSCCVDFTCSHIWLCLVNIFCVDFGLSLAFCFGIRVLYRDSSFGKFAVSSTTWELRLYTTLFIGSRFIYRIRHTGAMNLNKVLWYFSRLEVLTFHCGDLAGSSMDFFTRFQWICIAHWLVKMDRFLIWIKINLYTYIDHPYRPTTSNGLHWAFNSLDGTLRHSNNSDYCFRLLLVCYGSCWASNGSFLWWYLVIN